MANLQVNQIKRHLESNYIPHVDDSDIIETGEKKEIHVLSRALAAYSVASLGNYDPKEVCSNITDEFGDNGIDLIHVDVDSKKMWLVQSKFIVNGNKGVDCGELHKFIKGIEDLCNADYSHFGTKTKRLQAEIAQALQDAQFHIYIVIAYTGNNLSKDNNDILLPFISENNDPTEIMELVDFNLAKAHNILRQGLNTPITCSLHLKNWGQITTPYKSIYGIVDATEIATLWANHGTNLLSKNIRHFLGNTEANNAMIETLTNTPELFKYFNNGVSILCNTYKKTLYGGTNTELGIFECEGIEIVNGAQTVGTIGEYYRKTPLDGHSIAEVLVKIISLEGAPEDFSKKQTIANNTQNKVEKKDFASLSPVQQKLKDELRLNGINYHLKRGVDVPIVLDDYNYTFEEAAVALASYQQDVTLSVLAKREVGKLWESLSAAPYTDLFNETLSAVCLEHILFIYRRIQTVLKTLQKPDNEARTNRILVLGNIFITHLVFQRVTQADLENKSLNAPQFFENNIKPLVEYYANMTINTVNSNYTNSNIPQLFRNYTKCRDIKQKITSNTD